MLLLLLANTLNIAADVAAMGEVAELVTGFNRHLMTTLFVIGTLLLQVFVPYHRYVSFLKWLTLSLLAYAAVLFTVHVPWGQVALRTFWPRFTPDAAAAAVVVGVFGTTISPYLFFWQASEEVEDMQGRPGAAPLLRDAQAAPAELRRIRWDTWSGMLYSDLTAYFIILATAVTLHVAGITDINTAAQAASALRPLAGNFAFILFALGILGVGLIGVPVLAGSAGYALAEAMGWQSGLERKASDARGFYGVIAVSVLAGLVIQYSPISPMKALFWSAVINGVVAVPLMVVIILLVSRRRRHGTLYGKPLAHRPRLDRNRGHGSCSRADVHSRLGGDAMVSGLCLSARGLRPRLLLLSMLFAASGTAHQPLSGQDLVAALRTGGYVIAMRHASSPSAPPAAAQADVGNVQLERQLDVAGRASARAMGEALRRLHIPVGKVLSSPTYRALETVRLAELRATQDLFTARRCRPKHAS